MILLASDCLLFQMNGGESIPFSAEMISVELIGDAASVLDPEFVKHAAAAVFHYFKHDLNRLSVTVGEFSLALEKALRGSALANGRAPSREAGLQSNELDLRELVDEAGKAELFFFRSLREELRSQLQQSPQLIRFRGLRGCVKQLAGAQRWCVRCRNLQEQIVEYLRSCLSADAGDAGLRCGLVVVR